jgi:hypothetical protein
MTRLLVLHAAGAGTDLAAERAPILPRSSCPVVLVGRADRLVTSRV